MDIQTAPIMRLKDRPEYSGKPAPLCHPPEATVADAVADMSQKNYGSVIVTDADRKVLGVVTERDILKKLVNRGLDPKATELSAIMTSNPRVAGEDDDVLDWLRVMSNERFRRLPVVDADGRIKAVMTQGDFVSYTWPELAYQAKQIARATIGRNWGLVLVGGAVLLWILAVLVIILSV